ncbi:MAG: PDZ domain-containing protein [Planctomycetota bacterium]|jgi:S1-C subfamily serine protease
MVGKTNHASSGAVGQIVVMCLLAFFIVITLIAMFSTIGTSDEMVWIGITADPLDAETAAALGIPNDMGGVVVREVNGLAQRAGVRHGDVLLGINGNPVRDMAGFSKLAAETNLVGQGARLDIVRQGARIPVLVSPEGLPPAKLRTPGAPQPLEVVTPPVVVDRRWLGIDAETFTTGGGRALGIPAGVGGVLIDGVARGGRGERGGLKANDVIVSVNGRKVDTTADLWGLLAGLDGADWVELGLYRGGRLMSVSLPTAAGALAGGFPGRMGGFGPGPGGSLVCPNCGTRVTHQRAVPCFTVPCPSCGTLMTRVQ